ncbi:TonB family protein [Martelella sp. HB161492]|uniref:TonB family protein n=1 Tax=Martelella sp. HB161492 TaxID=2720726 RepID=UPI00158FABE3|nr:TonB family protein [Martelella sp. HB161492]
MDFDRSTFANGLPGGVRERDAGEPDPSVAPQAGREGDRAGDADGLFDQAVFDLIAQAKRSHAETDAASGMPAEDDAVADEAPQDIDPPSLPRIVPPGAKLPARGTVVFVLTSLVFHSMLLAMALNIVRAIPEAPAEEGSISVSVVMLGDGNVDAAAAGGKDEIINPVEVEATPVETTEIAPESEPEPVTPAETTAPDLPVTPEPPALSPVTPQPVLPETAKPAPPPPEPVTEDAVAALPVAEPVAVPVEAAEPAPLSPDVPDILAVAPIATPSQDTVAPSAPPPPDVAEAEASAPAPAEPVEAAALKPVQPETPEEIKAEVPDEAPTADALPPPEATPTPTPSPHKSAAVPKKPADRPAKSAPKPKPKTTSHGNEGQSATDARRGVASGEENARAADAARKSAEASGAGQASRTNYEGKIQRRLARAISPSRYYSRISERLKVTVTLRIVLDRSGRVGSIRLTRGSGNSEVDGIVLERAGRAGPFPPFPAGAYSENSKGFSMSVNLDLRR